MKSNPLILTGIRISLLSYAFCCLIHFLEPSVFPRSECMANGLGPLRTVNRMPINLMFLTPVPTTPATASSARLRGALDIDYARLFFENESAHWQALADMEMTIIEISVDYQLSRRFRLGINAPLVSMNRGFLDDVVENFHETFYLPDKDRNGRALNEFGYLLRKNGRDWISSRSGGAHLADSSIFLSWALLRETASFPLDVDLQYALKLPVGDADAGFSSGNFDHGIFFPMHISVLPWHMYFMPGWILPAPPDTLGADVTVTPMGSAFLGIEYALGPGLSLLGQINFYTSPLKKTGLPELDQDSVELSLGIAGQITPVTTLEIAFSEDLTRNGPDFSIHIGLRFNVD